MTELTIVRENLMTREGYAPYCGGCCGRMPRTIWNPDKGQFVCPDCSWVSNFPEDFIKRYREKWHK